MLKLLNKIIKISTQKLKERKKEWFSKLTRMKAAALIAHTGLHQSTKNNIVFNNTFFFVFLCNIERKF